MRNKARAACGEDRFGAGRGHKWEWGGATRWSLRRRLRMEGLREGRKEREREQRVPKQSRRQREEREVEGTGGRNLSRRINVVGSFFIF